MIVGLDPHGRVCFRDYGCEKVFVLTAMQIYTSEALLAMFDACDQDTIMQIVLGL